MKQDTFTDIEYSFRKKKTRRGRPPLEIEKCCGCICFRNFGGITVAFFCCQEGITMLRLEKVNGKNIWDILKLRVSGEQEGFVAGNDISIIEAYIALTANGHAFPFGVYADDTPVGFLMVGYDADDDWEDAPAIARGNYNLWRLMIDQGFQGRGYGREALRLALKFIRTYPCGPAECCWLSYEPENEAARRLYRSFGFAETGETDGEEVIAALRL